MNILTSMGEAKKETKKQPILLTVGNPNKGRGDADKKKRSTSATKNTVKPKGKTVQRKKIDHKVLVMVDGDNDPYNSMEGIKKKKNVVIKSYVNNENLRDNIKRKTGIESKVVKKTPQSVDNRIIGVIGNEVSGNEYDKIYILSHDKGYDSYIDKWSKSGMVIKRIESARDIE